MSEVHPCRPFPWAATLITAIALIALGSDLVHVPGPPEHVWSALYVLPAIGLIVWRATGRRPFLVASCMTIFAVSFTRAALVLIQYPDRRSGVAAHLLIAVFAALLLRAQGRCSK